MNSTTTFRLYNETSKMEIHDMAAVALLTAWTLGFLWFITNTSNNQIPAPPFYRRGNPVIEAASSDDEEPATTNNWTPIGIYHLNKPQTLSKKEREAIDAAGGGNASYLYEKTHASGKKSWRYGIGDNWFYPTETAVRRRGLDLYGNHMTNMD